MVTQGIECKNAKPLISEHVRLSLTCPRALTALPATHDAGGPRYQCADNLAICPDNPADVVDAVAARLKISLDEQFVLEASDPAKQSDIKPLFPTPCTVRRAFTRYVDLCGIPKKCAAEGGRGCANM